eukprot:snap_masked-scaffold_51-processed-gene-1.10-mRNA-1 protein AED:1.00 eAED:1.00 QI:0/0/0/0/1/1/4/0/325
MGRKPTTSKQIFESFVKRNSDGKLTRETIISKECFEAWLRTRKKEVKHPRESFRRTVCAHIRASDGRRPFSEDVETSLLKKMRRKDYNGENVDPFKLFTSSYLKKNTRDYKKSQLSFKYPYGFHEQRKAAENPQPEKKQNLIRRRRPVDPNFEVLRKLLEMGKEDLRSKIDFAASNGLTIFCPAIVYLLDHYSDISNYYKKEYAIPSPSSQYFTPGVPIGAHAINRKTWEITWRNETSRNSLCNPKSSLDIQSSIVEYFSLGRYCFPIMNKTGCSWFRSTVLTAEGRRVEVLGYMKRVSDETTMSYFQIFPEKVVDEGSCGQLFI